MVSLDSTGQHTLRWETPLRHGNVEVPKGSLNLYTYPGGYAGAQLGIVRRVMLELATNHIHLFKVPDPVGACILHALVVCNTEESIELALMVLRTEPQLLLQTHVGQPFLGEGLLHIACANRREQLGIAMVDLAIASLSRADLASCLSTQAVGVFFHDAPMCWYGDSPLSYACVFGLRRLVRLMLDTGVVSLNDDDSCGTLVGLHPVHAVAVNGLRGMYDFLVAGLPKELAADRNLVTRVAQGRLVELNVDGLLPLQLTAKLGLRFMFQVRRG